MIALLALACTTARVAPPNEFPPDAPEIPVTSALPADPPAPDTTVPADTGAPPERLDLDEDGLDDGEEQRIAEDYLPFLSLAPDDACPTMGIVYHAAIHPLDPTKIHITYVMLYDVDCGADGHVGDDEVFALTIDPAIAAPRGILAMRAIAHQDTPCGHDTLCGCAGSGLPPCETLPLAGEPWPVVYASRDKHGNYLFDADCDGSCFFTNECEPAASSPVPMLVNAGEPQRQLIGDLTAAGLITAANGWTSAGLFDFDPWGPDDFGSAGNIASDLTDPAFDTPVPVCGG
jgi:hypothetical protein